MTIQLSCDFIKSNLVPKNDSFIYKKWFKVALMVSSLVLFSVLTGFGGIGAFAVHGSLPSWLAHAVGTIGPGFNQAIFIGGLAGATASMIALYIVDRRKPIREETQDRIAKTSSDVNEALKALEKIEDPDLIEMTQFDLAARLVDQTIKGNRDNLFTAIQDQLKGIENVEIKDRMSCYAAIWLAEKGHVEVAIQLANHIVQPYHRDDALYGIVKLLIGRCAADDESSLNEILTVAEMIQTNEFKAKARELLKTFIQN